MCKRLFLIEIEEEDPLKLAIDVIEEEDSRDRPKIFLNALVGMTNPQTMIVTTKIGKVPLTMLIDMGSTQNFLHEPFTKLAGLHTQSNSSLRVVVAIREKLRSPRLCQEVTLNLQNLQFLVDFYLIKLEGVMLFWVLNC